MSDICPICGGKLGSEVLLNNPPMRGRKCKKCGRIEDVPKDTIIRQPKNGYRWKEPWSIY